MKKQLLQSFLFVLCLHLVQTTNAQQQAVITTTPSGVINGHEYVDLGLSVKWACENIQGASVSYNNRGERFAWGEIETKTKFNKSNSKTYKKKMGDISGDERYDAARALWGGTWRMPTKAEVEELLRECTWEIKDGWGYIVTGKNGNTVFFPFADLLRNKNKTFVGDYYWTSTPDETDKRYAYVLYLYWGLFESDESFSHYLKSYNGKLGLRSDGCVIRPVTE